LLYLGFVGEGESWREGGKGRLGAAMRGGGEKGAEGRGCAAMWGRCGKRRRGRTAVGCGAVRVAEGRNAVNRLSAVF
jgi:hypothetical protein